MKGGILVKRIVLFLFVVAALFLFSCAGLGLFGVDPSALAQEIVSTANGILKGTSATDTILTYIHKGAGATDQDVDEFGTGFAELITSIASEVSLIGVSEKITPNKFFFPSEPPDYFSGEVYSMDLLFETGDGTQLVMDMPMLVINGNPYICTVFVETPGSTQMYPLIFAF